MVVVGTILRMRTWWERRKGWGLGEAVGKRKNQREIMRRVVRRRTNDQGENGMDIK